MLEALEFYAPQLAAGLVLGALCAGLGVLLVLERRALFGATLSQAGVLALALATVAGWHGPLAAPLLSVLLVAPFLLSPGLERSDAALVAGWVIFAALTQVLTVATHLQSHLLAAYFGNILTVTPDQAAWALPAAGLLGIVYLFFYKDFVSLSFDPTHARLAGVAPFRTRLLYYVLLASGAAFCITLMGSFYTLAQLVLPALFALGFARSVWIALLLAVLYSLLATMLGFLISLEPIAYGEGEVNLPTSSMIILTLGAGVLLQRVFASARTLTKS